MKRPMNERFHDPGEPLEAYLDEVLVRCPRCDGKAWVRPAPMREGELPPPRDALLRAVDPA